MTLADLVSIDFEAELSKIAGAAFQGAWQLPTEWVRWLFAHGAAVVTVDLHPGEVHVRWQGVPVTAATLQALAALLDGQCPARHRHEALLALEATGSLVLAAFAGLAPTHLQIETGAPSDDDWLQLTATATAGPQLSRHPARPERTHSLHVVAPAFDARRGRDWLRAAAAHAGAFGKSIVLDGVALATVPSPTLAGWLSSPSGFVAPPRSPTRGQLVVVEHGIVAAHLTIGDAPTFDAVIELAGGAGDARPAGHDGAWARTQACAHLPALRARYRDLLLTALAAPARLAPARRARLSHAVLRALATEPPQSPLHGLGFLPVMSGGPTAELGWLSPANLSERGRAAGVVFVLAPGQDPADYVIGDAPVLIADEVERALLAERFALALRPPPSRTAHASLLARALGWLRRAREHLRGLHLPRTVAVFPEAALTPAEAELLGALTALLPPATPARVARMGPGGGPVRVRGDLLVLSRDNGTVRTAVRALQRDPAALYPVACALLPPRWTSRARLSGARHNWQTRRGPAAEPM